DRSFTATKENLRYGTGISNYMKKSASNRTLDLSEDEFVTFKSQLKILDQKGLESDLNNHILLGDCIQCMDYMPDKCINLLIADPPYNLTKNYNGQIFQKMSYNDYYNWLWSWIGKIPRVLKDTASIYICCDWQCSTQVESCLKRVVLIQNRISWEREKVAELIQIGKTLPKIFGLLL
ncbi:MAG: DNA methyltransferase, partial [Pedobacter agri]